MLKNQKSILITILALGLCLSLAQAQTTVTYSGKMTGTNPALVANGVWDPGLGTLYWASVSIKPELGVLEPLGLLTSTPGYQVYWETCWTLVSTSDMRCVYVSGWAPANTPGIVKQSQDSYRVNLDRNMILAGDGTPGGSIMTRCFGSPITCTTPAEPTSWPLTGTFSMLKPGDPEGFFTTQINGQVSTLWMGLSGNTDTLSFSGTATQSSGKFVGQAGDIPMAPTPAAGLRGTGTYYKGAMKAIATYTSN